MTYLAKGTLGLFGLFALMMMITPASAEAAKTVSVLGPPDVYDYSDSDNRIYSQREREIPAKSTKPSCYMEPEGFHNQIRSDSACALEAKRRRNEHIHEPGYQPKYQAPGGFHSQL